MVLCGDGRFKIAVVNKDGLSKPGRNGLKMAFRKVIQEPGVGLIGEEIASRGYRFSCIQIFVAQYDAVISQFRKIAFKACNRNIKASDEAVLNFDRRRLKPKRPQWPNFRKYLNKQHEDSGNKLDISLF